MTVTPQLPPGWRNDPGAATALLAVLRAKHQESNPPPTWDTPGELAKALDPTTIQTPALDLIDAALVRVQRGEIKRLIISMPPQEGKSERTTHYGALWLLHKNPDLRLGIVSYGDDIASGFSHKLRTDVQTYTGREGTPNLNMILQRDSKAASRWSLQYPAKGGVYAVGIGGALTGRPIDALFIDDPVKDFRNADSSLLSEQAWEWWQSVARPRLHPDAPVVLILTRWHESDLAGRLLTKQRQDEKDGLEDFDHWDVINIPALAEHDPDKGETDPLGREPGEFMLSARGRTPAQWRATRAATSARIWAALYQGKPSPDAGDVWKRQYWRFYNTMLWSTTNGSSFTVECDEMIQSWDMTFKDTKSSDYVVGQVWARRGANVYLIDQVRARLTFTDTLASVKAMTLKWPQAAAKLIEDKANGTAVIDTLNSKIGGIIPITPHESKYARANAVSPYLESGNVFLPSPDVQLFDAAELVEEAAGFPNGAHDDMVDAASQALSRLFIAGAGAAAWIESLRAKVAAQNEPVIIIQGEPLSDPLAAARLAEFREQYR